MKCTYMEKKKNLHKTKIKQPSQKIKENNLQKMNMTHNGVPSLQIFVTIILQKIKIKGGKNVQVKIQCHCNTVRLFSLFLSYSLRHFVSGTHRPLAEPRRWHPLGLSVQFIY